jgi:hypothetical protein
MPRMMVVVEEPIVEAPAPSHGDIAVARMLASPQFARAETQRKLLDYLWRHRDEPISEYAIAVEALGRQANFDPTTDASVRVHISRLRRKLKDYYVETGETELLLIPTGTHQLVLLAPNDESPVLTDAEVATPSPGWVRSHALSLLVSLCVCLFLVVVVLSVAVIHQKRIAPPKPNAFWTAFLAGDAPVKIVLPTPTFFSFRDHQTFKFRSRDINAFEDQKNDPDFQAVTSKLGPVELDQSYTVTWDTLAAIEIARYLDSIGQSTRVSFGLTRDSSLLALEQSNVIVLGTEHTLRPMHEYTESMNFSMFNDGERVANAHPQPGEPAFFVRQIQGRDRHVEPSIIALLPGRASGLKVLMLESRDTSGMVSVLTSNAGSHSVEELWRAHGSPEFFEMVMFTEMEGHNPLRTWPVAIHTYSKSSPAKGL